MKTIILLLVLMGVHSTPSTHSSHVRGPLASRRCALAIPPPQVAPIPRLEAIYVDGSVPLGWIVITEPVACD